MKPILDAVGAQLISVEDARISDMALEWEGEIIAAVRLPKLHGALDRLIEQVEKELGSPLPNLSRNDKQVAVKMLDQRGAFILRRAVEDVADAMGVSRITVYNYLNALHR
ncbi:MAG: helix-turn-helix domain-containing protein [Ilumatobacteraceae bacterium]